MQDCSIGLDLLWSDPGEKDGWVESSRGIGYIFGPDVTMEFNRQNNLKCICRAHQLYMHSYCWNKNNTVLTVFSAPNYCYRHGNLGAIAVIKETLDLNIISFEAAPAVEHGMPY